MPEVAANGLDVHYTIEGSGPPLVLLHAATSSAGQDWIAQAPLLRKEFTLIMPDARSHAGTRWDPLQGWSSDMLVDDLRAFVDALGLERFHIGGMSMGAGTAMAFAIGNPDRLISAMFASIAPEQEPRASVARHYLQPDVIEREDPKWAARLARLHDPVQGEGGWKRQMVAVREDIVSSSRPTPEQLRRIRLPVLLANGDRDPWVPLEQAVRLYRQLPDARLFVSPGVGHVIVSDRPAAFNQAFLQFLRLSSRGDG